MYHPAYECVAHLAALSFHTVILVIDADIVDTCLYAAEQQRSLEEAG